MSITTTVELSGSCAISLVEYDGGLGSGISLVYTEHPSNHWNSEEETDIDIDKEMAIAIIAILQKAYKLGEDK
jgi:hypothetical protein